MTYFISLLLVLFAYMNVWFLISLVQRRNDVADVAWGLGPVVLAWTGILLAGAPSVLSLLVSVVVTLWGTRLAWHIHRRHKGKDEDYRYKAWRVAWGKWFFLRSYAQIFLLQGALMFLVSLPVLMINRGGVSSFGLLALVGLTVWVVGFTFEVVGDAQLARFIRDPRNTGKLMRQGLWAYSRHPNYFGEVMSWWGIGLVALAAPYGWIGLVGPLTITFLILRVSGIPMLEKKLAAHPDFPDYARRTSVFIPLPPRP